MSMVSTESVEYVQDEQGRWVIPKDKDSTLDYSYDWTKWLAKVKDSIKILEVVLPTDSELELVQSRFDGAITTAWVSGGTTIDSLQALIFRITTNSTPARVEERTIYLRITER